MTQKRRKRHLFRGAISPAISVEHMRDEWFWILAGWLAARFYVAIFVPSFLSLLTNQTQSKEGKKKKKKHSLSNLFWYKYNIIMIRGLHYHEAFVTEAAGLRQEFSFCLSNMLYAERRWNESEKSNQLPSVMKEKKERRKKKN